MVVIHLPSGKRRRVTGINIFRKVIHFAQVIKMDGATLYWADASDCLPVLPL